MIRNQCGEKTSLNDRFRKTDAAFCDETKWHCSGRTLGRGDAGKENLHSQGAEKKDVFEVLRVARSQIGKWKYSVQSAKCEHFIQWVSGLEVTSTQVTNTAIGAATGALAVGLVAENPKFINFSGGALLVGGVALALTRAAEKPTQPESKSRENV